MNKFNPERLSVEYRDGVTATEPVISRHHTLTHSDDTGELFLTIGTQFAWDKVNNDMRDEVIGEWKTNGHCIYYNAYVMVNKEGQDFNTAMRRYEVFRRELPLALTAIRYGDRFLFNVYPALDNGLIIVNFISTYSQLYKQEIFGTYSSFSNSF
ncbi:staygreen family protein [Solibacillus silvestris]